jgi:hypothetical protein
VGNSRTGRVLGGRAIEKSGDTVCGLHHARGDEKARVSSLSLKTKIDNFLRFDLKTSGDGFSGLGLKIGSSDLVIWVSKSPRWFLVLCLKTKQTSICRLRHKTDGGREVRDTHRDLVACFTWKQVWLEFPSLA